MSLTVWSTVRVIVTLVGIYTVSRFTSPIVPFGQLLICSVIAIVVIRIWMPSPIKEDPKPDVETFTS